MSLCKFVLQAHDIVIATVAIKFGSCKLEQILHPCLNQTEFAVIQFN